MRKTKGYRKDATYKKYIGNIITLIGVNNTIIKDNRFVSCMINTSTTDKKYLDLMKDTIDALGYDLKRVQYDVFNPLSRYESDVYFYVPKENTEGYGFYIMYDKKKVIPQDINNRFIGGRAVFEELSDDGRGFVLKYIDKI